MTLAHDLLMQKMKEEEETLLLLNDPSCYKKTLVEEITVDFDNTKLQEDVVLTTIYFDRNEKILDSGELLIKLTLIVAIGLLLAMLIWRLTT